MKNSWSFTLSLVVALGLSSCSSKEEKVSREVITRELSEHKRFEGSLYQNVPINSMPSTSQPGGPVRVTYAAATEPYFLEITNFDPKSGRTEAQITYRDSLPPVPDELKRYLRSGDPSTKSPATEPRQQPVTFTLEGKFQKGSLVLSGVNGDPTPMNVRYTLTGERYEWANPAIETMSITRIREKSQVAETAKKLSPYEGTREDWLQRR